MPYKIVKLLLFAALLWAIVSCGKTAIYTIYLKNNSNLSLYFTISNLYPDTTVQTIYYMVTIFPGATQPIIIARSSISFSSAGDILEIFLLDNNVVNTNPWDSIVSKNLIVKRYDLTSDSLQKLNWQVVYP